MPEIASIPDRPARAAAAQTPPSAAPPPAVTRVALDRRPSGSRPPDAVRSPGIPRRPRGCSSPCPGARGDATPPTRAARSARERLLRPDAAEEARRAADPPGRVAGQGLVLGDRALLGRELQIHRPDEGEDETPAARPPPRSSATTPQPPGSFCSRAMPSGFRRRRTGTSTKAAIQAQSGRARDQDGARGGPELPGDLVDDDAAGILGLERPADRPRHGHAEEADGEPGHQESEPGAENRDVRREEPGEQQGRRASRPFPERAVRGPSRSRWREAPRTDGRRRRGGPATLTPGRAGEKIRSSSSRPAAPSSESIIARAIRSRSQSRSRKVRTCPASNPTKNGAPSKRR